MSRQWRVGKIRQQTEDRLAISQGPSASSPMIIGWVRTCAWFRTTDSAASERCRWSIQIEVSTRISPSVDDAEVTRPADCCRREQPGDANSPG